MFNGAGFLSALKQAAMIRSAPTEWAPKETNPPPNPPPLDAEAQRPQHFSTASVSQPSQDWYSTMGAFESAPSAQPATWPLVKPAPLKRVESAETVRNSSSPPMMTPLSPQVSSSSRLSHSSAFPPERQFPQQPRHLPAQQQGHLSQPWRIDLPEQEDVARLTRKRSEPAARPADGSHISQSWSPGNGAAMLVRAHSSPAWRQEKRPRHSASESNLFSNNSTAAASWRPGDNVRELQAALSGAFGSQASAPHPGASDLQQARGGFLAQNRHQQHPRQQHSQPQQLPQHGRESKGEVELLALVRALLGAQQQSAAPCSSASASASVSASAPAMTHCASPHGYGGANSSTRLRLAQVPSWGSLPEASPTRPQDHNAEGYNRRSQQQAAQPATCQRALSLLSSPTPEPPQNAPPPPGRCLLEPNAQNGSFKVLLQQGKGQDVDKTSQRILGNQTNQMSNSWSNSGTQRASNEAPFLAPLASAAVTHPSLPRIEESRQETQALARQESQPESAETLVPLVNSHSTNSVSMSNILLLEEIPATPEHCGHDGTFTSGPSFCEKEKQFESVLEDGSGDGGVFDSLEDMVRGFDWDDPWSCGADNAVDMGLP